MSILCSAWLVSTQSVEQTSLAGAIPVVQLLAMVTWGTVSSHGYPGYRISYLNAQCLNTQQDFKASLCPIKMWHSGIGHLGAI